MDTRHVIHIYALFGSSNVIYILVFCVCLCVCFSKAEYVIYKLKEMEKITDKDIIPISKQFDKLDRCSNGKITLGDLLESSSGD